MVDSTSKGYSCLLIPFPPPPSLPPSLCPFLSLLSFSPFTVQLPIYKTRLSILLSVVQPSHAIAVGVFTILGMGGGRCLAELGGYWRMWEPCEG